jgi:hypothetical protein
MQLSSFVICPIDHQIYCPVRFVSKISYHIFVIKNLHIRRIHIVNLHHPTQINKANFSGLQNGHICRGKICINEAKILKPIV